MGLHRRRTLVDVKKGEETASRRGPGEDASEAPVLSTSQHTHSSSSQPHTRSTPSSSHDNPHWIFHWKLPPSKKGRISCHCPPPPVSQPSIPFRRISWSASTLSPRGYTLSSPSASPPPPVDNNTSHNNDNNNLPNMRRFSWSVISPLSPRVPRCADAGGSSPQSALPRRHGPKLHTSPEVCCFPPSPRIGGGRYKTTTPRQQPRRLSWSDYSIAPSPIFSSCASWKPQGLNFTPRGPLSG